MMISYHRHSFSTTNNLLKQSRPSQRRKVVSAALSEAAEDPVLTIGIG